MMRAGDLMEIIGMKKRLASDTPDGRSRVPESACVECGAKRDGAGTPDGEPIAPAQGDITVCIFCGAIMTFGEDLRPRCLTQDEERHLVQTPGLMERIRAIRSRVHLARHGSD
jgi:hypothetical protein